MPELQTYRDFTSDRAEAVKAVDEAGTDPEMLRTGENRARQNFRDLQVLELDEQSSRRDDDDIVSPINAAREIEAAIQRAASVFADS